MREGAIHIKESTKIIEKEITDGVLVITDINQLRKNGPVRCPLCGIGTIYISSPKNRNRIAWECRNCRKRFAPRLCKSCGSFCQALDTGGNYQCVGCEKPLFMSRSTADPNVICLKCGSSHIRKRGKAGGDTSMPGAQLYYCNDCGYHFCPCALGNENGLNLHWWADLTPPSCVKCPKCGTDKILQSSPGKRRFGMWMFHCNNGCKQKNGQKLLFCKTVSQDQWPTQDGIPEEWKKHKKYKKED